MIVNVQLADNRTLFQFASRGDLQQAMAHAPGEEVRGVQAWMRSPLTGNEWIEVRAAFVRKHSVMFVIEAEAIAEETGLPAKATADERKRKWEEREAVQGAAA